MSLWEALVIVLAGLGAGTINTVVGSGTLITFPTLVAFGVGYAVIVWFMRMIENRSYTVFVVYRVVAGLVLLILLWTGLVDPLGGA